MRLKTGPYGGTAGEIAEATLTLGLDGEPTFGPITATLRRALAEDQAAEETAA